MSELERLYRALEGEYGDLRWWPADTDFEVALGAILTQNTSWKNVESVLDNLRDHGLLSPDSLEKMKPAELAPLIKSSGYYNQKAVRVIRFTRWLADFAGGSMENLADYSTEELRRELLSIRGIGPETCDDILLYALDRPVFVVDSYTFRIAFRHGLIPPDVGYDELSSLFACSLPANVDIFKNFHACLVEVGKTYCKKKGPLCENCPARITLNGNPPREPI